MGRGGNGGTGSLLSPRQRPRVIVGTGSVDSMTRDNQNKSHLRYCRRQNDSSRSQRTRSQNRSRTKPLSSSPLPTTAAPNQSHRSHGSSTPSKKKNIHQLSTSSLLARRGEGRETHRGVHEAKHEERLVLLRSREDSSKQRPPRVEPAGSGFPVPSFTHTDAIGEGTIVTILGSTPPRLSLLALSRCAGTHVVARKVAMTSI